MKGFQLCPIKCKEANIIFQLMQMLILIKLKINLAYNQIKGNCHANFSSKDELLPFLNEYLKF